MLEARPSNIFVNQWAVCGIVTLLLLALAEAGCRFGMASRRRNPEAAAGHSGRVRWAVCGGPCAVGRVRWAVCGGPCAAC